MRNSPLSTVDLLEVTTTSQDAAEGICESVALMELGVQVDVT